MIRYRYAWIAVWMRTARLPRAADIGIDAARGRLLVPQLQENTVTVLALP